jgi:hypothetical protein
MQIVKNKTIDPSKICLNYRTSEDEWKQWILVIYATETLVLIMSQCSFASLCQWILVICAACVNEYFNDSDLEVIRNKSSEDPIYEGYKAVLDSKSIDETLVSFPNSFSFFYCIEVSS